MFICTLSPDGSGTEVGPGDDLVNAEGGVVTAIVVVRVHMDDLVSRLC